MNNKEYSSKSELVNDLIPQAGGKQKEIDFNRKKLENAVKSGFTQNTKEEIQFISKKSMNKKIQTE